MSSDTLKTVNRRDSVHTTRDAEELDSVEDMSPTPVVISAVRVDTEAEDTEAEVDASMESSGHSAAGNREDHKAGDARTSHDRRRRKSEVLKLTSTGNLLVPTPSSSSSSSSSFCDVTHQSCYEKESQCHWSKLKYDFYHDGVMSRQIMGINMRECTINPGPEGGKKICRFSHHDMIIFNLIISIGVDIFFNSSFCDLLVFHYVLAPFPSIPP